MRELYPGHLFELDELDGNGSTQRLQFVQRLPHHQPKPGVLNQEVLRALIRRVERLDAERPWAGNGEILYHLQMALVLHEARALVRHVEQGKIQPELVALGIDGHFKLEFLK